MTAGVLLKKNLGLSAFKNVYYGRVIGIGGYKIYFIFYDSRIPNWRITSWDAFRKDFAPTILFRDNGRRLSLTNVVPIEEWSGNESGCLFVRVDLAGRFLNPLQYSIKESLAKKEVFVEDMTIEDFKDTAAISAMTQKFRTIRRNMLGKETMHVRLMKVDFDQKSDWVEFEFRSRSTPNTPIKQKANPSSNFALYPNPPKIYLLKARFNKFFTWMFDTLPEGQELSLADMKDAVKVCPVQLWSNSPAFHWQGHNHVLSQLDAAIYPTSIAPQHWNQAKYHGDDAMLDKHLAALTRNISFFLNNMTSMLNKNLQAAGIIGKVKYSYQP